ncbi:PKD domain-containing protein, partial [Flavobacteriales bacterium]|nr:PKD domain-containing protein [Flavobacteriales bacterium]
DGGSTWSAPIEVDLSTFPSITSNLTSGVASAAFQIDLAVDANGNPHTVFNVCSGDNTGYTVQSTDWMGACHLHHNGISWEADILGQIQTLRKTLTDGVSMDNTPQISITDDGNIMAFSWTDSDPLLTGGDNSLPFLNVVAYNTNTAVYSTLETADICSLDPGKIAFLHCADRLLETTQGYEIAAVVSDINASGSGTDQTGHVYFSYPIPNVCSASANISAVASACVNETITLVDNSTNTSGYIYNWDINNDGTTDYISNGNVTHSYPSSGFMTANLLLDDGSGCLSSSSVSLMINDLPDLNVAFNSTVCGLTQIDYIDNSSVSSPAVYSWDFDGDNLEDSNTPGDQSFTPISTGTLNGSLEVTDANGCINTQPLTVTTDLVSVANFNLPSTGCTNELITVTDASTNGTIYSWDMDNNGIEDYNITGNVSHIYSSSGLYTVELIVTSGNCTDSYTAQINIEDNPIADFNIISQGGTSYLFQDISTGGGTNLWNFGDGNTSNINGDISHTYADDNSYTVTLTKTNNCGSHSFFTQTPSTVDIENYMDEEFLIYPNPTSGLLFISTEKTGAYQVEIFDLRGRIIYKEMRESKKSEFDLSLCDAGVYVLKVTNDKGSQEVRIMKR